MFLCDPAAPYSETPQKLRFADTPKRISADVLDKGQDSKGDFRIGLGPVFQIVKKIRIND
jgi:hypothetical protein